MKKIISLFQRNYETDRLVRDEIVPSAEWVARGEGVATRKFDGTACMVRGAKLYKRYDVKAGRGVPDGAIPCEEGPDEITGHFPHWIPVGGGPEDKWFRAARLPERDGSYELCGPHFQGNPENFARDEFIQHGGMVEAAPRTYEGLQHWFKGKDIEGIVWHHPDGRMVKIKKRDFGLRRLG